MFKLPKFGDGLCLARLARLMERLEIDRKWLERSSVAVTGSNGKGSTTAFCGAIAHAYGLRTGMFTSPHLYSFTERFRVGTTTIDDEALGEYVARVEKAIGAVERAGDAFGAFEAQFALACLYFQDSRCTFNVFEAGIGGRYDPTRMLGASCACVTSVDLEHVDLLGDSLESICSDKSDVCAAGGTIVYGENCRSLRPHIVEYNRNRSIVSYFVRDEIVIANPSNTTATQRFDFRHGDFAIQALETKLLGAFQYNNAAIATALFLAWLKSAGADHSPTRIELAVRNGLRDAQLPGRLEVIKRDPLTVIDVGHTPDGIRQALAGQQTIYGKDRWILVTGVSADKRADQIVGMLAPFFDTIVCTRAYHKGAPVEAIASTARAANPVAEIYTASTVEEAVRLSQQLAAQLHKRVFVAGGLFLAAEYATALSSGNPRSLQFF